MKGAAQSFGTPALGGDAVYGSTKRHVTREASALVESEVLQCELKLIWTAVDLGILSLSSHARHAARDDATPEGTVLRVPILDIGRC